jgi:hypothetical protein
MVGEAGEVADFHLLARGGERCARDLAGGDVAGGGEGEEGGGLLDLGVVVGIADGTVPHGVVIGGVVNLEGGDGTDCGLELVEQADGESGGVAHGGGEKVNARHGGSQ